MGGTGQNGREVANGRVNSWASGTRGASVPVLAWDVRLRLGHVTLKAQFCMQCGLCTV